MKTIVIKLVDYMDDATPSERDAEQYELNLTYLANEYGLAETMGMINRLDQPPEPMDSKSVQEA